MINLLFWILLTANPQLEDVIKQLKPDINPKVLQMVTDVIENRSSKYGFSNADHKLIVSMIMKESNFSHIYGKHGEVGMLQVIPEDGHIMKIVAGIECKDSEKYCKNFLPDVYSGGSLTSYKVRRFISEHHHYALETGLGEMQYWHDAYLKTLKQRYWEKYPRWYLETNLSGYGERERSLKYWWNNLVTKAGDLVWISHYNWGPKLSTAPASRNYALSVLKILEQIN
jgi:hypothetical protein